MQFPLLRFQDNPARGIMFRGVTGISMVVVLVALGTRLVGTLPWIWFASFGGMIIVALYGMLWLFTKIDPGFAEITDSHLFVKSKHGGRERYRLDDIADVRVKWAWWGRVPYVELHLRRSIMLGIWTNDRGTDIAGIPTLYRKRAVIIVENAEGFAVELLRRLPPAGV